MNRLDHIRYLFGPAFRLYAHVEYADTPTDAPAVPSAQDVCATFIKAGCVCVVVWSESAVTARDEGGCTLAAARSSQGWLITGGPLNLLSYGARDADGMARFPGVLKAVSSHAATLDNTSH